MRIGIGIGIGFRRRASGAAPPAAPSLTAPTATSPSPNAVFGFGEVLAYSAASTDGVVDLIELVLDEGGSETVIDSDTSTDTLAGNWPVDATAYVAHTLSVRVTRGGTTSSAPLAFTVSRVGYRRDVVFANGNWTAPANIWGLDGTRNEAAVGGLAPGGAGQAGVGGGGGGAGSYTPDVAITPEAVYAVTVDAGANFTFATAVVAERGQNRADAGGGPAAGGDAANGAGTTKVSGGVGTDDASAGTGGTSADIPPIFGVSVGGGNTRRRFGSGGGNSGGAASPGAQGICMVEYYTLVPPGFPYIAAVSQRGARDTNQNNHTCVLPGVSPFEPTALGRLIGIGAVDFGTTWSADDWTLLTQATEAGAIGTVVMHREADGADPTTWTTGGAARAAAMLVVRVLAPDGGVPPAPTWTPFNASATSALDSGEHTAPGGSGKHLWATIVGSDNGAAAMTSAAPTDYHTALIVPHAQVGANLVVAFRQRETDAENPGAWGVSLGNEERAGGTLVVEAS